MHCYTKLHIIYRFQTEDEIHLCASSIQGHLSSTAPLLKTNTFYLLRHSGHSSLSSFNLLANVTFTPINGFQSTYNHCLSMCQACIYGTELVRLQPSAVKLHGDVVMVELAGKSISVVHRHWLVCTVSVTLYAL